MNEVGPSKMEADLFKASPFAEEYPLSKEQVYQAAHQVRAVFSGDRDFTPWVRAERVGRVVCIVSGQEREQGVDR